MADYPEQGGVESRYDNFRAEKESIRDELKAESVREPSLEDELENLADQHRRLNSLMTEIHHTKKRIEEKNNVVGSRIGKLYEAIALTSRGEFPMEDKGQW